MTYNTRIYNYANLHSEDKQIVQAQLLMLESVEDTITNYTYAKETSTNTLETISFEEGIHALEEAKQNMYNDIVEYMIFAIDSYENEVYELDTDDPFYGLYVEMEDSKMNNVETVNFSTANLERLAFYFKNLKMEVSGKWYTTTKF